MLNYFPKYFANKAVILYFISLLFVSIIFISYSLPFLWFCWGIVEVLFFFYFSNILTKQWCNLSPRLFKKKVFWTAFSISFFYVFVTYFLYSYLRGEPFEYDPSDGLGYHNEAVWCYDLLLKGQFDEYTKFFNSFHEFSDKGYQVYIDGLYLLISPNIFIARVLKAFYRAWMCVLVYKLASRTFGEGVGRTAAIFCLLMPNFSFYAGSHRKEMEMICLGVWFMERADFIIRSKKYNFLNLVLPVLLLVALFSFRTVLGISAIFAFLSTILLSEKNIIGKKKKWTIAIWIFLCTLTVGGGTIANEVEDLWTTKVEGKQGKDMEWRSKNKEGNSYAKYAGASVFAPIILVMPFPSMIDVAQQYNQQRLNGGYFIKNVLAFFVMLSLVKVIREKKWRKFILIYSFTLSYLIIIAFSNFAQSERFHLPALPFLLILAAYGINDFISKDKKYFKVYLVILFIIIIAWNWYKLAGRGVV